MTTKVARSKPKGVRAEVSRYEGGPRPVDPGNVRTIIPRNFMSAPRQACAACGKPTPSTALVPNREEIGAVPMHLTCSGALVIAYRKTLEGEEFTLEESDALAHLAGFVDGMLFGARKARIG